MNIVGSTKKERCPIYNLRTTRSHLSVTYHMRIINEKTFHDKSKSRLLTELIRRETFAKNNLLYCNLKSITENVFQTDRLYRLLFDTGCSYITCKSFKNKKIIAHSLYHCIK